MYINIFYIHLKTLCIFYRYTSVKHEAITEILEKRHFTEVGLEGIRLIKWGRGSCSDPFCGNIIRSSPFTVLISSEIVLIQCIWSHVSFMSPSPSYVWRTNVDPHAFDYSQWDSCLPVKDTRSEYRTTFSLLCTKYWNSLTVTVNSMLIFNYQCLVTRSLLFSYGLIIPLGCFLVNLVRSFTPFRRVTLIRTRLKFYFSSPIDLFPFLVFWFNLLLSPLILTR